MALQNPPNWLQKGSYSAVNARSLIRGQMASSGVVDLSDFKVIQTPTSSMQVRVSPGHAFVAGTTNPATQGYYHCYNDGYVTLTVPTANATNPRLDLVVLRINDSEVVGSQDSATLEIIQGAPSSTPVAPAQPANSLLLATLLVRAGAALIADSSISDRRYSGGAASSVAVQTVDSLASARGTRIGGLAYENLTQGLFVWSGSAWRTVNGPYSCTSNSRPQNAFYGMEIYEQDTGYRRVWNGSIWRFQSFTGARNEVNAPWGQWVAQRPHPSGVGVGFTTGNQWTTNRASPIVRRPQGDDANFVVTETGLYALHLQTYCNPQYFLSGQMAGIINYTGSLQPASALGRFEEGPNGGGFTGSSVVDISTSATAYLYDGDQVSVSGNQYNVQGWTLPATYNFSITLIG